MTLFLLAILAGFLTVLAPCILPILPIVLGAGTGASKWRPVFVVLGFVLAFSVFGAFFATVGTFLGISNAALRMLAVVLLILFGLSLVFEGVYQKMTAGVSAKLNALGAKVSGGSVGKTSAVSGLLVGVSLGLIWTPCAGPILGTILTLAATNGNLVTTGALFAAYAIGAGVPMLGIAYGSGWIFERMKKIGAKAELLNKVFGALVIVTALAIAFGYDSVIQTYLVQYYPSQLFHLESSLGSSNETTPTPGQDLPRLGQMPAFQGIAGWLNSSPLTPADLKGKVVLVDFWTYSCINCIRTYPYLRDWWTKYKDDGLVIIGVHTPEFDFEKNYDNVAHAAEQNDLAYPIALDNDYKTWNAYGNRYWPATYIFDKDGELRYTHHGEGNYDVTEGVIQELLSVSGQMTETPPMDFAMIQSPETYFGYARSERFVSPEPTKHDATATYSYPANVPLNDWALQGDWAITSEYAQAQAAGAKLQFRYNAGSANFVLEPPAGGPAEVNVYVDGAFVKTLDVTDSSLYEAYKGDPGEHTVELEFLNAGTKAYTITFGA